MRSDIENYVKNCKLCQVNKPLKTCNKAPMVITSTSTKPFERLALDIVGPLPEAGLQNFKFLLTLQDDLTKFLCVYPMVTSSSDEVARTLNDWHCYLATAIFSYNTTPHTNTTYTPYELLYGYKPTIPNSLYNTIMIQLIMNTSAHYNIA
ncbi:unnamed protein product [Parnassius mnemosyne]|uniref:Integrase zinc-binding domain-containing protein n=1 Tax=Parnassius mnemosyne TaxID=213953 RepID=A0AAV1MAI0_9NEOP